MKILLVAGVALSIFLAILFWPRPVHEPNDARLLMRSRLYEWSEEKDNWILMSEGPSSSNPAGPGKFQRVLFFSDGTQENEFFELNIATTSLPLAAIPGR